MARLPRLDEEIEEETEDESPTTSRPKAPNFSRPQPQRPNSSARLKHDKTDPAAVHSISAFHEPNRDLPEEPRFSIESDRTVTTNSDNSAGSDFAWDGELGELRSKTRPKQFDSQRYTKPSSSSGSSRSTIRDGSSTDRSLLVGLPDSDTSSNTSKASKIIKRVSVDQQSERLSMSSAPSQWEDTASHHTVSDSGDSGSFDMEGRWQSSDYDVSSLSEAEIRKLKKKGINPSLYAEMKAAKQGKKKFVGSLLGNGFIG